MKNRDHKNRSQNPGVWSRKGWTWLTVALYLMLAVALSASGQPPQSVTPAREAESNAVALYQSLLDLQNPWTVMCVAAHPDDEDGATLTVLRRKYGVHTVTVFSTYGEGGQNAVGPELYEELGAIRARETMQAAEIQGSEPYFLGLRDFGFSKSSTEAFRFWGQTEALRRMVLKIRQLRPDVIITNHDTMSGHGHHQATGLLILEAFDAAADPRRFPEQLRGGLTTWQPQRLFVRFQFEGSGSKAAEDEAQRTNQIITVNRNERDDVRGQTFAEQALLALRKHATQGPWPQTVPAGWATPIRYRLARSAKDAAALPPNPQTFLDGLQLPQELADKLAPLSVRALLPLASAGAHQDVLSALVNARKGGLFAPPLNVKDTARFQLMKKRLDDALVVASGIKATLTPHNDVLIAGTSSGVTLKISNEGDHPARIRDIELGRGLRPSSRLKFPQTIAPRGTITVELQTSTPPAAALSVPHAEHLYDEKLFGEELAANINVEINGATFPLATTTRADITPAVEIRSVTPSPLVITYANSILIPNRILTGVGQRPTVHLLLINHLDEVFSGEVSGNRGNKFNASRSAITIPAKGTLDVEMRAGGFFLDDLGSRGLHPIPDNVLYTIRRDGSPDIIARREIRVVWSEAHVAPGLRVGYVRSVDETLRNALTALGVEAKELKVEDVSAGDLQSYQAIIIDNRGYQAHPELVGANSRLLDYVKAGGTLIVFYHRVNEWNPDQQRNRPQLAPYPIVLGNSRVTNEDAPISFSEPQHPLLNYPNKITQADFMGWVQERGLYYPQTWDSHYSAPLASSDEGETPLRGGLLAADYGRGRYIYTSMVWYRQLRAGLPGAYRILANMISYGH